MLASIMRHARPAAIGVGICLVFVAGTAAARHTAASPSAPRFQTPLGNRLPDVTLETPDGRRVSLRERLNGRPALIYIFGADECAGCSNLPFEFKIVHNEVPGLQTLLIGSGAGRSVFRPLIHEMGLEELALVDSGRTVLGALDLSLEPLVLLADSAGQIVLVDTRSASRAAQFPMGRLLHTLRGVLTDANSHTPQVARSPLP